MKASLGLIFALVGIATKANSLPPADPTIGGSERFDEKPVLIQIFENVDNAPKVPANMRLCTPNCHQEIYDKPIYVVTKLDEDKVADVIYYEEGLKNLHPAHKAMIMKSPMKKVGFIYTQFDFPVDHFPHILDVQVDKPTFVDGKERVTPYLIFINEGMEHVLNRGLQYQLVANVELSVNGVDVNVVNRKTRRSPEGEEEPTEAPDVNKYKEDNSKKWEWINNWFPYGIPDAFPWGYNVNPSSYFPNRPYPFNPYNFPQNFTNFQSPFYPYWPAPYQNFPYQNIFPQQPFNPFYPNQFNGYNPYFPNAPGPQSGYNPYARSTQDTHSSDPAYQHDPGRQSGYNPYERRSQDTHSSGPEYQNDPGRQSGYNPYERRTQDIHSSGPEYQNDPGRQSGYNPYERRTQDIHSSGPEYQNDPRRQSGYNPYERRTQDTHSSGPEYQNDEVEYQEDNVYPNSHANHKFPTSHLQHQGISPFQSLDVWPIKSWPPHVPASHNQRSQARNENEKDNLKDNFPSPQEYYWNLFRNYQLFQSLYSFYSKYYPFFQNYGGYNQFANNNFYNQNYGWNQNYAQNWNNNPFYSYSPYYGQYNPSYIPWYYYASNQYPAYNRPNFPNYYYNYQGNYYGNQNYPPYYGNFGNFNYPFYSPYSNFQNYGQGYPKY